MNSKKEIKSVYYLNLIASISFFIMMITAIIFLITSSPSFFELGEKISSFIKYTFIVIFIIVIVWLAYKIFICLKDFSAVRKNNFKEVIGKIVKYKRNESETGLQLNNHLIIKILNSTDKLELLINKGTELNKTYVFIYLKHTKIGAVKEEYMQ